MYKVNVPSTFFAKKLHAIFKENGFKIAAEFFKFDEHPKKQMMAKIAAWDNYPKSMEIYPTVLTKKIYNEESTQYVRV